MVSLGCSCRTVHLLLYSTILSIKFCEKAGIIADEKKQAQCRCGAGYVPPYVSQNLFREKNGSGKMRGD